jgi:molybdenum cofactor synthesis domain-containing protein
MELMKAKELGAELVSSKDIEWVVLEEALGRVLGKTVSAHRDLPQEPRSRMDGFAIQSSDTLSASPEKPAVLKITPETIAAGHIPQRKLESGQCARIFTGACLPMEADAVAPAEKAIEQKDQVILKQSVASGEWVSLPGEEVRQGELIAAKGSHLTPTRLALIAALGHAQIPVYRQPQVALLATGDEVKEVGTITEGPWTACNNRHLLAWLVRLQGGNPFSLGVVGDDPKAIADRLEKTNADLVITTGGMGQGERDFILQVWKRLGIKVVFYHLNLSPGKNSALGVRGNRIYCGLTGNPWGAQVVFEEIITPLLWRWQGRESKTIPSVTATLKGAIKKRKGEYKAIRGQLDVQTVPPSFTPLGKQKGSLFAALRSGTAYTLIDPQMEEVPSGSRVRVRLYDFPAQAVSSLGLESCSAEKQSFLCP